MHLCGPMSDGHSDDVLGVTESKPLFQGLLSIKA
jgi:hypothetical protein